LVRLGIFERSGRGVLQSATEATLAAAAADADVAVELVKAEKMALRTKNVRG
jgi:hypothetical protein